MTGRIRVGGIAVRQEVVALVVLLLVGCGLGLGLGRLLAGEPRVSPTDFAVLIAQIYERDRNRDLAEERLRAAGFSRPAESVAALARSFPTPTAGAARDAQSLRELASGLGRPVVEPGTAPAPAAGSGPSWLLSVLVVLLALGLGALLAARILGLPLRLPSFAWLARALESQSASRPRRGPAAGSPASLTRGVAAGPRSGRERWAASAVDHPGGRASEPRPAPAARPAGATDTAAFGALAEVLRESAGGPRPATRSGALAAADRASSAPVRPLVSAGVAAAPAAPPSAGPRTGRATADVEDEPEPDAADELAADVAPETRPVGRGSAAAAGARRQLSFRSTYRWGDEPYDEIHPISDGLSPSLAGACWVSAVRALDGEGPRRYWAITIAAHDYAGGGELRTLALVTRWAYANYADEIDDWLQSGEVVEVRQAERGGYVELETTNLMVGISVEEVECGEGVPPDAYFTRLTAQFDVELR